MRELGVVKFDSKTYSDRNMILNFNLATPAEIDMNLTYLWGRDEDRFPLLTLTAVKELLILKLKLMVEILSTLGLLQLVFVLLQELRNLLLPQILRVLILVLSKY